MNIFVLDDEEVIVEALCSMLKKSVVREIIYMDILIVISS